MFNYLIQTNHYFSFVCIYISKDAPAVRVRTEEPANLHHTITSNSSASAPLRSRECTAVSTVTYDVV